MNDIIAEILIIENNDADSELTKRIMIKEFKQPYRLTIIDNGADAWEYLKKNEKYKNSITPHLILLDLNLPVMDGWEVLDKIKKSSKLKHIPVIILTTSESQRDIDRAYQQHSNSYIVKPLDIVEFSKVIKLIENYWLTTVKLPECA